MNIPADADAVRERLAQLVVKSGVMLGGLSQADRLLALALPASRLPVGETATEAEVNARLRDSLGEEAAFIDVDHVELRRWLVDSGWWRRDGFGRRYERVPADALPEGLRQVADALAGLALPDWVDGCRDAHRCRREQRRQAWQQSGRAD
jgi:hypothetical protein